MKDACLGVKDSTGANLLQLSLILEWTENAVFSEQTASKRYPGSFSVYETYITYES